jgi:hypothetical protein
MRQNGRATASVAALRTSNWSDEQLVTILRESAKWTIVGTHGQSLCFAASLGRATERTEEQAKADAIVVAIPRRDPSEIIVPFTQLFRLRRMIAGGEIHAARQARPAV